MVIRATRFTPELLLGAPRRSSGVPNAQGTVALYSVSTYSFEHHNKTVEIRALDLNSNESRLVIQSEDAGSPTWLDGERIILLVSEEGATNIVVGNVNNFEKTKYVAGTIDAAAGDLKVKGIGNGTFIIAVSAPTKPDGTLFNSEKAEKPLTTGRLYNSTFVRHWDSWVTPNKNSIWIGALSKSPNDTAKLTLDELTNPLKDTGLESPIPPFGGVDNYDISADSLVFVAKDPSLNPAYNTKQNLYLVKLVDSSSDGNASVKKIGLSGFEGATSSPVFSHDGQQVAFLSMRENGYEADKNQIFLLDINDLDSPDLLFATPDGRGSWDRSPSSVWWSWDDTQLHVVADDNARDSLFTIPLSDSLARILPASIFSAGGVSDVTVLESGLFVSSTSLVDDSAYHFIPTSSTSSILLSSNSNNGSKFGLSRSQISEIHFPGAADDTTIQAWVIKPSDFDEKKKYPLAYLIHGGPQGSWGDSWSTRWNLAMFAEQGYVVVAPNPTGSTGFGQLLTDAIKEQWGGLPYLDIVNGFNYIEENLDYVDISKAVALGASYGGYMMNWIQGNDLGRRLKALVTHDGVFSMTGQLASEEIYFPNREFGGIFWENEKKWLEWDPAQHAGNWSTPHLIIHSDKDYRLTISEGLAAFNVLQQRGVESQFLTFPDENHWVLKPENSLLWHTVVLDFINTKAGLPTYSTQSGAAAKLKASAFSG